MTETDLGDQLLEADASLAVLPDRPVSSSTTVTDPAGQPSSTARSANAYWRAADSTLRSTCPNVDWRTYTTARRRRCASVTFPCSLIALLLHQPRQQARQPARSPAGAWRQRLPHRRPDHSLLAHHERQLSRHAHLRFHRRLRPAPDAPPQRLEALTQQPPRRRRRDHAQRALPTVRRGRSVHRAGISPTLPSTSRQTTTVSPEASSVVQPRTSSSDHAALPARPPAAPAPATDPQHE